MNEQILKILGFYILGILIMALITKKRPIDVVIELVHPVILGLLLAFRVAL